LKRTEKTCNVYRDIGVKGLHHLVYEVIDKFDRRGAGWFLQQDDVIIHEDNSITVTDNGRGIPRDDGEGKEVALEVVMTVLHAGGNSTRIL